MHPYSRRSRRRFSHRRQKKNWIPFLVFVGVLSFFFWVLFQFFSLLFSTVRTEIASSDLEILKGRAEFKLSQEDSSWTPAFTGQTFVEGDQIKTVKNSKVKLGFLTQNTLFLDQQSELTFEALSKKSSGKKTSHLYLDQGQIWARIDSAQFQDADLADFQFKTKRLVAHIKGTIINITSSSEADTVKLIKGKAEVDILDSEGEVTQTLELGVGQELIVDDSLTAKLDSGVDVINIIPNEFIESSWHLDNLMVFFPEEANDIKSKIEVQTPPVTNDTDSEASEENTEEIVGEIPSVTILSPAEGETVPATVDLVKIEGTAPVEAFQIQVNGYTLSKFQPGDRKWSYFAATKFGTLKSGTNQYSVMAISREGKKSTPAKVTINYEGVTPETSNDSTTETQSTFPPPVVTRPAIFTDNPSATYETSATVVTFAGTVPRGTNAVEVNGFRLRKFKPGDTAFSYIANANYGNMKEGENLYKVVAFGPDSTQSETEIKIVYTPIDLSQ